MASAYSQQDSEGCCDRHAAGQIAPHPLHHAANLFHIWLLCLEMGQSARADLRNVCVIWPKRISRALIHLIRSLTADFLPSGV
jgi:hypothetical protein